MQLTLKETESRLLQSQREKMKGNLPHSVARTKYLPDVMTFQKMD